MLCTCALAQSPSGLNPLVGRWIYVDALKCTDIYEFRSDGTFSSTSGAEVLDGAYIMDAPDANGISYRVLRTINKGNGLRDCAGYVTKVGRVDTRYVLFKRRFTELVVCPSPTAPECFGPLRRIEY